VSEGRRQDPDRRVHWAILCLGGLALVLFALAHVAGAGALGDGSVSGLARSHSLTTAGDVLWVLSVLLAAFFAGLDERWGWLIAILLAPLAQMVFAAVPLYEARFKREEQLDYTSASARAAADAEHSFRGS
jgi:hypothetical protein